jgi:hypothetical protein
MLVRRISIIGVGTVAAVALGLGPAGAHFCYANNMTPQAMAGASASSGFLSFHDLAAEFTGLCDAGIEVLADVVEGQGRSRHQPPRLRRDRRRVPGRRRRLLLTDGSGESPCHRLTRGRG